MGFTSALAIYFIIWWLVLFMVLPFGVHTQKEAGDVVEGSAESAPVTPNIFRKMVITSFISGLVFALVYVVLVYKMIRLDDLPQPF